MGQSGRRHRIAAIIVTHGNLGQELIKASRYIMGDTGSLFSFSNDSLFNNGKEFNTILKDSLYEHIFIFLDFIGSSASYKVKELTKNFTNTTIMGGVNLPMILDFISYRERLPVKELTDKILHAGKRSILKI